MLISITNESYRNHKYILVAAEIGSQASDSTLYIVMIYRIEGAGCVIIEISEFLLHLISIFCIISVTSCRPGPGLLHYENEQVAYIFYLVYAEKSGTVEERNTRTYLYSVCIMHDPKKVACLFQKMYVYEPYIRSVAI